PVKHGVSISDKLRYIVRALISIHKSVSSGDPIGLWRTIDSRSSNIPSEILANSASVIKAIHKLEHTPKFVHNASISNVDFRKISRFVSITNGRHTLPGVPHVPERTGQAVFIGSKKKSLDSSVCGTPVAKYQSNG